MKPLNLNSDKTSNMIISDDDRSLLLQRLSNRIVDCETALIMAGACDAFLLSVVATVRQFYPFDVPVLTRIVNMTWNHSNLDSFANELLFALDCAMIAVNGVNLNEK